MTKMSDVKAKMEYRYLGNSGLRVSVLSFGAWVNWNAKTEDVAVIFPPFLARVEKSSKTKRPWC